MNEIQPNLKPEPTKKENPSRIDKYLASIDRTVSNRFKKLISPEKIKTVKAAIKTQIQRGAKPIALGILLSEMLVCGGETVDVNPNLLVNLYSQAESVEIPQSSISVDLLKQLSVLKYEDYDGVKIAFDEDGMPAKYLMPNGKEAIFDKEKIESLRETAISSKEPEIIAEIGVFNNTQLENAEITQSRVDYSTEHPRVLELPVDVLSEEELAAKGVKIIQADNLTLSIRKQAFEEGGPLAELAKQHGSEKLTIVLVNGPLVAREFMKDKKYDEVRGLVFNLQDSVGKYRLAKVNELQNRLERLHWLVANRKEYADLIELNSFYILKLKAAIYAYAKGMTDEQVLDQESLVSNDAGLYDSGAINVSGIKKIGFLNRTIFIAVGQSMGEGLLGDVVYFDSNGKLCITTLPVTDPVFFYPPPSNSSQSYPNPENFSINSRASPDNPKSYPYAGQSIGFALRHELTHDEKIAQAVNKGKMPDFSEYNTDIEAMQGIRSAWDKWKKSGDNSGYYFIFGLPKEQGGGFIITENSKSQPTKASAKS